MFKEVFIMMNIKKLTAVLLAGSLTCMAPAAVYASDTSETISEDVLMENEIDSLLSDPDKAVDVILYVKDLIDQQDISDEEILSFIDQASEHFGISFSDDEKNSLLNIIKAVKDMEINEEELRSTVTKVYDKMEELGIGKEEVKGFLEKAVDFIQSLF